MKELKKIMQVEDDHDILEIAGLSLEAVGGFEVQQYSLGSDAVESAEEFAPDLILLDVMMPVMGGVETLQLLRQRKPLSEIPVIFMTAKNKSELDLTPDLDAYVIGVINKPFDTMGLPHEIRELWSSYHAG